jgi:hypothetical protein
MGLAVEEAGRYVMLHNATCNTATCGQTSLQTAFTDLGYSSPSACTIVLGNIVAPSSGAICVSASKTTGTPDTLTLIAVYAYDNIIVPAGLVAGILSGPFTVSSQATYPLD